MRGLRSGLEASKHRRASKDRQASKEWLRGEPVLAPPSSRPSLLISRQASKEWLRGQGTQARNGLDRHASKEWLRGQARKQGMA